MVTSVHQLDDGGWVSVDDARQVAVSNLRFLARSDLCGCRPVDFLAEGFVEASVDPPAVEDRIAGRCLDCGAEGVTDRLELGRADPRTGAFRPVVPGSVHVPGRRTRLATPRRRGPGTPG